MVILLCLRIDGNMHADSEAVPEMPTLMPSLFFSVIIHMDAADARKGKPSKEPSASNHVVYTEFHGSARGSMGGEQGRHPAHNALSTNDMFLLYSVYS